MTKITIKTDQTSDQKKIIATIDTFTIEGNFKFWNKKYYAKKVPLELKMIGSSSDYFDLFHANYCMKNDEV